MIDEYQAAVDAGLTKFVSDVASKRITKQNARYELKPVSDRAAKDIKRITGVDVSGNKTVIEARQVAHILKDHGENGLADQTMRDINDIGRIQWVIDNYDSSKDGGVTEAYVTVKQNGKHGRAHTVVFEKAVNGTYYVIEAVPDTAKKTTYIVSAYMSKSGAKKTAPSSVTGKSPRDTPQHAARVAVSDTVPQEAADVNPRNEQTLTAALEAEQSNLPKGTGAAELGFTGKETPVDAWVAEAQGIGDRAIHDVSAEATANLARQQHRAPQDVPKYDKDGRLTRAGVEAVINSGFTDNAFAQRMLEETFEGAASYSQFSDKRALRKAKTDIKKQGYAEATAKYLLDSFNGKVSKQSTVTGLVLLDNAIAAKDYELAVKLTVALAEDGTNSAQALQARRLLNKMTPSGKLYAVTQVADRAAAAQRERIGEARIDIAEEEMQHAKNLRSILEMEGKPVADLTEEWRAARAALYGELS